MQQVLALIGFEIVTGITVYYFDFPFSSQPLHLLFASLLFGHSYLLFHLFQPTQSTSNDLSFHIILDAPGDFSATSKLRLAPV